MRGVDDIRAAALIHGIELDRGEWLSPSGVRELTNKKAGDADGSLPLIGPSSVAASGTLFGQGPLLAACLLSHGASARPTAKEVILGSGIAKTFGMDVGRDTLGPGDLVKIGPVTWYVAGVMKENNSSYGSEIWAMDTHVQGTFGRGLGSYSSFVARTKSERIGVKAAKELKDNRSGLRSYNAFTEQEYFAKLTSANVGMRVTIIVIAVIITIAGALGVMITMFAAISQRTKDIGVLRLLGFTRFQILCSFLLESLVIAALGGLIGLAVGYAFGDGRVVNSIVGGQGGGGKSVVFRTMVDLSVLMSAGILTFLMGAVGGFIPAISAMRLRPLESLR
jgi:ABC-type antimicrobial peptide transport system permease subunit